MVSVADVSQVFLVVELMNRCRVREKSEVRTARGRLDC